MKRKIFAVEDDISLQELYVYNLENDFDCRCFADGKSFFRALTHDMPDLILLDIMLPGEDGFVILSRLKADKTTAHIPVIIVSAKGEEIFKVKGLNMGANDYIAKPFGILELIARIKANLRKNTETMMQNIVYKDIVIDLTKHQIIVNGKQISATLKEYNLLCLLCSNAEKIQKRESIFINIWGNNFTGKTRTLDIHIKEIRKKLSEAESKVAIQTIRGVGHILT